MEWMPWEHLHSIGPWALAVLIVLSFMTGMIVPGPPARKEALLWRKAFFTEQEMRRDMEVTGQLQRQLLKSLPTPPEDTP